MSNSFYTKKEFLDSFKELELDFGKDLNKKLIIEAYNKIEIKYANLARMGIKPPVTWKKKIKPKSFCLKHSIMNS